MNMMMTPSSSRTKKRLVLLPVDRQNSVKALRLYMKRPMAQRSWCEPPPGEVLVQDGDSENQANQTGNERHVIHSFPSWPNLVLSYLSCMPSVKTETIRPPEIPTI